MGPLTKTKTHHGKELRRLVEADKRTIEELAEVMQVGRKSIYRWMEQASWNVKNRKIRNIELAGYPYDDIINGTLKASQKINALDPSFATKLMERLSFLELEIEEAKADREILASQLRLAKNSITELEFAILGRRRPVEQLSDKNKAIKTKR